MGLNNANDYLLKLFFKGYESAEEKPEDGEDEANT